MGRLAKIGCEEGEFNLEINVAVSQFSLLVLHLNLTTLFL